MKRTELKKEYRDLLRSNYQLRISIAVDIATHEDTILRWAKSDTDKSAKKLTTEGFLNAFRKHTGITSQLTEEVEVPQTQAA